MSESDHRRNEERIHSLKEHARFILKHDDGDGHGPSMNDRVTRLETQFEYVRRDLDDIKADLKTAVASLSVLPTKQDLMNNLLVATGIGLAVLAIVVGGIIGGLAWVAPDDKAPQMVAPAPPPAVIVQVPTPSPPAK